ncbi:MAG: hypothetical protein R6X20_05605 [Phycisphaerae bacterium]
MRRRRTRTWRWRRTNQRCPHCGCPGLMRAYHGRRLMLERCPDCGAEWPHAMKAVPSRR